MVGSVATDYRVTSPTIQRPPPFDPPMAYAFGWVLVGCVFSTLNVVWMKLNQDDTSFTLLDNNLQRILHI